jgi:hypothetical protein
MDSESRDQYPPGNLMGWETGFKSDADSVAALVALKYPV